MPATHSKGFGFKACLPLFSHFNHLGTEDTDCCSFASSIWLHSCWIQDLSCSSVCGSCLILLFMMYHTFSTADRSVHTLCLCNHSVRGCSEWSLALSCWNNHLHLRKRQRLDGILCVQYFDVRCTWNHHRCWVLHFSLITSSKVFLILGK